MNSPPRESFSASRLNALLAWLATPRRAFAQLLALSLFRLWLAARLPISGDEALMWYWTKWPDWCFVEHPGLMPAITGLTTGLFGDHLWSVRLGAVIFSALLAVVAFRMTATLRDRATGWLVAAALSVNPLVMAAGLLQLTDIFYAALSLAALYEFLRAKENPRRYIYAGILCGLAINAKLLAAFWPPALGLALVAARPEDLRRREVWIGGGLCALAALPVLGWNAAHGWATFAIRFGYQVEPRPTLSHLALLAASGCILLTPFIFFPALKTLLLLPKLLWERRDAAAVLGLPAAALLAAVAVKSLRSGVAPHWPIFAYFPLIILAASLRLKRRWLALGLISGAAVSALLITLALNPRLIPAQFNLGARFERVDGRRFKADLIAAQPLAARLSTELDRLGLGAFLLSDGYGRLTGMRLALAPRRPPPDIALLDAQNRNAANFQLWEPYMQLDGRPALFFTVDDPRDNAEVESRARRLFAACCRAPDLILTQEGVELERERILRCENFQGFAARARPPVAEPVPACSGP